MRDSKIDFYKGMLILCVVYGHMNNVLLCGVSHAPIWLHTFVRTFDMAFFMILSGWFLRKSLTKNGAWYILINRVSMLLVPIAIWTLILLRVDFVSRYYFLWAVFASSVICIIGNVIKSKLGRILEVTFYVGVVVSLYFVKIPWNLFYLLPFFIFGYYLKDVRFELTSKSYLVTAVVFVVLLCFCDPAYTPWKINSLAWQMDSLAFVIYFYRFVLAVLGVYVMSKVFDYVSNFIEIRYPALWVNVCGWGRETLGLYILQAIILEGVLYKIVMFLYKHCKIVVLDPVVNFVGYVLSPLLSIIFIFIIYWILCKIKAKKLMKNAFGCKVFCR